MNLWTDNRSAQYALPPKLSVANLKVCPLCDSLNARNNPSCFVCGWRGEFIHDSHQVHLSLVLLLEQCPELADAAWEQQPRPSLLAQMVAFFRFKILRRPRLDLRA